MGRLLLDEFDQVVMLRGVTVRGFERATPVGESFVAPIERDELELLSRWGANAVIVEIGQDLVLEGRDEAGGEDYLETLDKTITAASSAGLYTIVQLSLVSSVIPTAVGAAGDKFDPALPDAESIDLWAILARRYADEPAVIFDVFRSPHNPEPGDSTVSLLPRLTWPVWQCWLLSMLGEIRRAHPRAVIIARGLDRGKDVSGFPLYFSDGSRPTNVIYGAQLGDGDERLALQALDALGRKEAVGVFTWMPQPFEVSAVETLGRRLASAGYHWIAGGWTNGSMQLVQAHRGHLEATPLGRAFRMAFAEPRAPAVSLAPVLYMSKLSAMPSSSQDLITPWMEDSPR